MTKWPGGTCIFSRDSVGAIGIQPQLFHWKYNGKNMVVTYMIGMDSICLKYVNEGEVGMLYAILYT